MTTNYTATFITASPDSTATAGTMPAKANSIAQLQHALLTRHPYHYTSDDLLFEVYAIRNGIAPRDRKPAREAFFARPQACLRASPWSSNSAGASITTPSRKWPSMASTARHIANSLRART